MNGVVEEFEFEYDLVVNLSGGYDLIERYGKDACWAKAAHIDDYNNAIEILRLLRLAVKQEEDLEEQE